MALSCSLSHHFIGIGAMRGLYAQGLEAGAGIGNLRGTVKEYPRLGDQYQHHANAARADRISRADTTAGISPALAQALGHRLRTV